VRVGDDAPDIVYTELLGGPGPWTSANLCGQVTALICFPYISGNRHLVREWNERVEQFEGKPVQFLWVASEEQDTLLPFLKANPVRGWLFNDLEGRTTRAYGIEMPQPVIIGADGRIAGFDKGMVPREEALSAALEGRVTHTPPEPTPEASREFAASGKVLLAPEPRRLVRALDHRPKRSPSETLHVSPANTPNAGGNFAADDYLSLHSYTLRQFLAEVTNVNEVRIDLAAELDDRRKYDFELVLPRTADRAAMREIMLRGAEEYFKITVLHESRVCEVYVVAATDRTPPECADSGNLGFAWSMSGGAYSVCVENDAGEFPESPPQGIDSIATISAAGATLDDFCRMVESGADLPLINETGLPGRFDLEVTGGVDFGHDFTARMHEQLGLKVTRAQRKIETIVVRPQ
jgi:uncharacterized protein (TIGR03435 family)